MEKLMFLDELTPVVREITSHPVAFLGGFFSGLFRLNLNDDPVKSWLDQQSGSSVSPSDAPPSSNGSGPQSISID
ncbi:hypothetical protein [Leptolyngbya sp. O-77]|uniref:hypothetical protein n=1 Tax=Leptolyngbya sp. O-77 TaxID=1080068 RepID=UPI002938F959|nr:hypothetical protein [Leptolyngbya sp. O-77]